MAAKRRAPDARPNPFALALAGASKALQATQAKLDEELIVVATGHPYLDWALGGEMPCLEFPKGKPGGIILGTQIEISGPESSGKSLLAACYMAEVQKNLHGGTGRGAWIDAERCFSKDFYHGLGLDTSADKLAVYEPNSGEEGIALIMWLAKKRVVDVIVVDSVTALVPEAETVDMIVDGAVVGGKRVYKEVGQAQIGAHARMFSQTLRSLTPTLSANNVSVIWINQLRTKMQKVGNQTVVSQDTTGGNALKFYCSQRISVKKNKPITIKRKHPFTHAPIEEVVAIQPTIKMIKNKVGRPGREVVVTFALSRGYDLTHDVLQAALLQGWIPKTKKKDDVAAPGGWGAGALPAKDEDSKGSWYDLSEFSAYTTVERVQGVAALKAIVMASEPFQKYLVARVVDEAKKALLASPDVIDEETGEVIEPEPIYDGAVEGGEPVAEA